MAQSQFTSLGHAPTFVVPPTGQWPTRARFQGLGHKTFSWEMGHDTIIQQ